MKYLTSTILAVLVTGLLTTTLWAQQGRPGPRMGWNQQWNNAERPFARIPNLTDEQREQVRQIHLDAQEQNLELRNQLNEKQARLRTVTTGETVDMDEANQLIDKMSTIRADLMKQRLQTRMQVRELLTDEQKVVFDTRGPFNCGDLCGNRPSRGVGGRGGNW